MFLIANCLLVCILFIYFFQFQLQKEKIWLNQLIWFCTKPFYFFKENIFLEVQLTYKGLHIFTMYTSVSLDYAHTCETMTTKCGSLWVSQLALMSCEPPDHSWGPCGKEQEAQAHVVSLGVSFQQGLWEAHFARFSHSLVPLASLQELGWGGWWS